MGHGAAAAAAGTRGAAGKALHSSTFRLNFSAFSGIGVHAVVVVWELSGGIKEYQGVQGVLCVRNGLG